MNRSSGTQLNRASDQTGSRKFIRGHSQASFGNALDRQSPSKLSKESYLRDKLCLLAEKASLRLVMKELHAQMAHVDDVFARKNIQNEMILNNEDQSPMQMKSFLEISMNSNLAIRFNDADRLNALE